MWKIKKCECFVSYSHVVNKVLSEKVLELTAMVNKEVGKFCKLLPHVVKKELGESYVSFYHDKYKRQWCSV